MPIVALYTSNGASAAVSLEPGRHEICDQKKYSVSILYAQQKVVTNKYKPGMSVNGINPSCHVQFGAPGGLDLEDGYPNFDTARQAAYDAVRHINIALVMSLQRLIGTAIPTLSDADDAPKLDKGFECPLPDGMKLVCGEPTGYEGERTMSIEIPIHVSEIPEFAVTIEFMSREYYRQYAGYGASLKTIADKIIRDLDAVSCTLMCSVEQNKFGEQ